MIWGWPRQPTGRPDGRRRHRQREWRCPENMENIQTKHQSSISWRNNKANEIQMHKKEWRCPQGSGMSEESRLRLGPFVESYTVGSLGAPFSGTYIYIYIWCTVWYIYIYIYIYLCIHIHMCLFAAGLRRFHRSRTVFLNPIPTVFMWIWLQFRQL